MESLEKSREGGVVSGRWSVVRSKRLLTTATDHRPLSPQRTMEIKKGIGVSPGVVISTAVVLDAEDLAIPRRHIAAEEVDKEIDRFRDAVTKSQQELAVLRTQMTEKYSEEIGDRKSVV